MFDTELSYANSSQDVTRFPLYDAINDDSMENFLNRLQSAPLGGPYLTNNFNNISPFDPRYYLVRSGISSWVASPSTEVVDSLTAVRFEARQRWQTKRGMPGESTDYRLACLRYGTYALSPRTAELRPVCGSD